MGDIKIGNLNIDKVYFGNSEVDKIYYGNTKIYESGPVVDPVLNNNSWAVIKQVCESGQASNYWAVGDTKTDLGTDGNTRTFRIADMSGLYGKNVVFEQVELTMNYAAWNESSNVDDDNAYNDYAISDMVSTHLPAYELLLSSDLQAILTNTTVKVAKNGISTTLVDTTQKLFLPAEKEVYTSRVYSREEEFNTLTTWAYYLTHTSINEHKKYDTNSTASNYWLRSPCYNYDYLACMVNINGGSQKSSCPSGYHIAPCFSL